MAIKQSKIPMSRARKQQLISVQLSDIQRLFFPISSSEGLGEDATLESQVKSYLHKLCQVSCHICLQLGPTMKQHKHWTNEFAPSSVTFCSETYFSRCMSHGS